MSKAALRQHLVDGVSLRRLAHKQFISCIRTGRMIAYVGSYATQSFGYRSWDAFLTEEAKAMVGVNTPPWVDFAIKKIEAKDPNAPLLFDLIENWHDATVGSRAAGRAGLAESFRLKAARRLLGGTPYHVIESLGIDRVITTNYDMEFEWIAMTTADERRRMLRELATLAAPERADYFEDFEGRLHIERCSDTRSLIRHLPDGRSAISDVFDRERSDRLMEFAIGSPDYESHILHLHGRATDPETLIVSTHDYLEQYRRSGITKLPFEHAQKMLFAGNPVLFVGMGMSEADLTAVLEQFVSDHPHRDSAPAFVLWSPQLKNRRRARDEFKVSDEDELRRLSWYRRFGALTLFDSELPGFVPARKPTDDMAVSVRSLATFAKQHVTSFDWKPDHFRSMQERLDQRPGDSRYDIWTRTRGIDGFNVELIDTNVPKSPIARIQTINDLRDGDLLKSLFCGAPVKAFIDPPGSGHGLLARILAEAFTRELPLVPSVPGTVCSVINANFMCEADSAFSLLSGLYDNRTAFSDQMSRKAALQRYASQIAECVTGKDRLKRSVLVVINGMERFFDTSGHPLSSEVDNAIRAIFAVYKMEIPLPGGASTNVQRWVEDNDSVNPYSIMLLGTARVERYLESLARGANGNGGKRPFAILNTERLSNGTLVLDELADRLARVNPGRPATRFTSAPRDDLPSAYLSSVERAFDARNCPRSELSIARQTLMAQSARKTRGDQRHSFMTAYLRSGTIQRALPAHGKHLADLCLDVLSVLAFVGQPIEPAALARAPRIATRVAGLGGGSALHNALKFLVEVNLALEFDTFPGSAPGVHRYGLHRAVMAELRDRHGVPISDAKLFNGFNLSLFASQPIDDYTPEDELHEELSGLVDAMVEAAESASDPAAASELASYLRTALALVRGYFTTSALLMHEPPGPEGHRARLTQHADRLLNLIRLAEEAAERWSAAGSDAERDALNPRPLFPDEIVWLHNERGVVKLVQGDLYEARISFDQALSVNSHHVEFEDRLQNWRSIQLNQLHVDVERGKISRAESRILEIEKAIEEHASTFATATARRHSDAIVEEYARPRPEVRDVDENYPSDLILASGLITGYKGLCGFLRGQLKTSQKYFEDSIEVLRNLGEQRAYSLLQRNYTSLLFAIGDRPKAHETIRLCISAADSYRQLDISYLARITEIDYQFATEQRNNAEIEPELRRAVEYAANTDMYRVRMEARKTLATVRLSAGDYDGALEHAAEAMSIAIRYGFSLRKISLRILIGQILKRRGDPKSGSALLERARRNADRIGYQRAVRLVHQVRIAEDIGG